MNSSILNRLLGMLILLIIPLLIGAQCSFNKKVSEVLQTKDKAKMLNLTKQLINCPQLQDSLALSYHNIGIHFNKRNLDSAIYYTKKGLAIRKDLFSAKPNEDLGKSYFNTGCFYNKKNQIKFAKEYLLDAIKVYEIVDSSRMLNSYLELGLAHMLEGNYPQAIEIYKFVINEASKINEEGIKARALLECGNTLNLHKKYSQSIIYSTQALEIYTKNEVVKRQAKCHINLGKSYFELGDYPNAIENNLRTIELYDHIEMDYELPKTQNNLAINYLRNNQEEASYRVLKDALKNAQAINAKMITVQSFNNFGEYYTSKEDYHSALSNIQKAIQTLIPRFNQNEVTQNPSKTDIDLAIHKIDLLTCFGDKARTLRKLERTENNPKFLTSALELYELGDIVIDQLRKGHQDNETKLFWREEAIPFYEKAIELCYEMQDVKKAFFFFEKSKSILLLEALQTSDALDLIPDSLKNHILTLQQNLLETKEKKESAKSGDSRRDGIVQELVSMQAEFDFELQKLEKKYPKYYEVKFGTKVLSLADAKNEFTNYQEREAIHYFYGENNIYAITIRFDQAEFHQLGTTDSIDKEIRKLLYFYEESSNIDNAPNDFLQQSKRVYDILIAPLSLAGEEGLIIFPDGALAYLPFEALIFSDSDDIITADYLIKHRNIHYGYSATINFRLNKNSNKSNVNSIAAFAPFSDGSVNSKYPILDYSQDELSEISKRIAGVFLKNKNATKQYFLENCNDFSVLHLSTHAFSSATENKPHIVFADTSLYLSELYGLEIPADLVVVSACQSNIGKLYPGEGVMSLGRGFTFAGSKSLISSLWNVNAVSTGTILSDFYEKMDNGNSKSESLNAAKLAYLGNENISSYDRSPYYWAGMICYGDDSGLILKKKSNNKGLIFLMIGFVCFSIGFFLYKKYFSGPSKED